MAIIPVVRCSRIKAYVEFYTKTLDFHLADDDKLNDPAFIFLRRAGDLLAVSSYGSGPIQQSVALVMTEDVDALFANFLARGLTPAQPDSPVHRGTTDQTWGTREFYVDDPVGNTLAFTQATS